MKAVFVHLGREHLGIESLSALLKREGCQTALACDPGLFSQNDNTFYLPRLAQWFERRGEVLETIVREKADLVAFTAYTGTYRWCTEIARTVKERCNVPVVFGGVHPSLVPERVLTDGLADFVVVGEGEGATLDVMEMIRQGTSRTDIPNTCCVLDGKVIRNPIRPPLDVSTLPLPDKTLFERHVSYRDDYMIMTSRGCPYNCTYCCEWDTNRLYAGRFFRRRSVEHVMDELREGKKHYRFREVMFFDSVLFTDKDWLADLLACFKTEIGVPFRCEGHVNFLDREIALWLKQAGCYCVEFGLQSMNERIRREVLRRPESQEQVENALGICDDVGLRYDVDLIFDLPGQTTEDLERAAVFFSSARSLNRLKTYNLTYFPRTPILEIARRYGILKEEQLTVIERGEMPGDFFHEDSFPEDVDRRVKAAFRFLFKAIPILPRALVQRIVARRGYDTLSLVPRALHVLVEIVVALKNRDRRYAIHAKRYARALLLLILKGGND